MYAAYYSVRMFGRWSIVPREGDQMAKSIGFVKKGTIEKKTSTSGSHTMIKTSSMNKNKRANYKRYRGQGR